MHSAQIIHLKSRSMENNIIISRLEEKVTESKASEYLSNVIRNLLITELEMKDADADIYRLTNCSAWETLTHGDNIHVEYARSSMTRFTKTWSRAE